MAHKLQSLSPVVFSSAERMALIVAIEVTRRGLRKRGVDADEQLEVSNLRDMLTAARRKLVRAGLKVI